ncbi:MAG: hypothetical protein H3C68_06535 [Deltaproteobacteria bacterium]|nr:hypothetical protein [Deltaproteobacteria bacterium]MBZ0219587.1 OprO/OprP family phosphate-selective porin [Deltaproteobacteria bacterium]
MIVLPAQSKAGEVEIKPPRLSGYVEGWFRSDASDLSSQTTAAKKVDSEFRVRRARLGASGSVNEKLGYRLTASLDGPGPGASPSTVKLFDAYATYAVSEYASLTFGQFKYDFTLEGVEGTTSRLPVLRAEVINEIAGKLGTVGGSLRDIGARVSGTIKDLYGLKYGVSVINGSGLNTGDNNGDKDVVGRVTITPVNGLTVGVSGYRGQGGDEGALLEVNESAYGFEADYAGNGFSLRAEYVAAEWENWSVASGAPSAGQSQKPRGWYAQGSFTLPFEERIELLGRYEDFEKDAGTADSRLKTTTVGATYHISGKNRITANYLFRDAGANPIVTAQETNATGRNIGDLFLLQAILVF